MSKKVPVSKSPSAASPDHHHASVLRHLSAIAAEIGTVTLSEDERARLRIRWRTYTPSLARAAADMIEKDPSHFGWVPRSAAELRQAEDEIRNLMAIKVSVDKLSAAIDDTLIVRKSQLHGETASIMDGIDALLRSPLTGPAVRARLTELSASARAIISEHVAQTVQTRANTLSRKAEESAAIKALQARVERLSTENKILRGETVSGEDITRASLAPAAKARRRGRRGPQK